MPEPEECCKRNFFQSAADSVKRLAEDRTTVPEDVRLQRMQICEACPHMSPLKQCQICLCYLPLKTKFANMVCPLPEPKWTEYDANSN